MSVSVSIPEELYEKAAAIAKSQNMSVDEVFASAFAEHLAAWERLRQRAARGSREEFLAVLDKVPDASRKLDRDDFRLMACSPVSLRRD
jgi:hypothetical protein